MKKLIVSSIIVLATLTAGASVTQARNINNQVSKSAIAQFCAGKIAGKEYRVTTTTRSGATLTGTILCSNVSQVMGNGHEGNEGFEGNEANEGNEGFEGNEGNEANESMSLGN